jgi:phosphoglycerate dehydrogenase-like enzyme
MLALARLVPAADQAMKDGRWEQKRFLGNELRGKTLGLAGLGRIGQEVAQRARSFGMRIIAHDPFISAEIASTLGVELLTLDQLCATADYISLHLPLTGDTKHLFNDGRFATCKPGLRLINTARGGLVDSEALAAALRAGELGGAGIDVLAAEPPPTNHPLLAADIPNLIVTPHVAWTAQEARQRALDQVTENIADYLRGGALRRLV